MSEPKIEVKQVRSNVELNNIIHEIEVKVMSSFGVPAEIMGTPENIPPNSEIRCIQCEMKGA